MPQRYKKGRAAAVTLYQLIRETLDEHGGSCLRAELLVAILANPHAAERLSCSQGFSRLLQNMRNSGFIELNGELVRRTKRRVRRRRI